MWPASVSGPALSFTRAMARVEFEHVAKVFPDGTRAVDDLTLAIRDGEFVVIVGPFGSRKTTALRMVAGLEEISEGTIAIGDRVVNHSCPRPEDRDGLSDVCALSTPLGVREPRLRASSVQSEPFSIRRARGSAQSPWDRIWVAARS